MGIKVMWFRQDLRLADNPAWHAATNACASGQAVLPIYILDDVNADGFAMGGASRWWLHQSLTQLNHALDGKMAFFKGDAEAILKHLCACLSIDEVHWNRCYEPWRMVRDKRIKAALDAGRVKGHSHNGSLLMEPWQTCKRDGTPYQVYTPFSKHVMQRIAERDSYGLVPLPDTVHFHRQVHTAASKSHGLVDDGLDTYQLSLDELGLIPTRDWYRGFCQVAQPGEAEAMAKCLAFVSNKVQCYQANRDVMASDGSSSLSAHLHFGEISPRQVWRILDSQVASETSLAFKRQLIWREFAYTNLYYFQDMPTHNIKPAFNQFAWWQKGGKDTSETGDDGYANAWHSQALRRWQQGNTGIPLVDAGMRQLREAGTMHNRVRMICASFLCKNLLIHWREGAKWFWDNLLDADLAINSASWQWVAGCGLDAAPYFRVFNPVLQGEKFDPDGIYTRQFLPELARVPKKYLHQPWAQSNAHKSQSDLLATKPYPAPLVDLKVSRQRALAAYQNSR